MSCVKLMFMFCLVLCFISSNFWTITCEWKGKSLEVSNFEKELLESKIPIVVKFHAAWCGACTRMESLDSKMKKEFSENIKFIQVDIDENRDLARKHGIMGIPTYFVFMNGKSSNENHVGMIQEATYRNWLKTVLRKCSNKRLS